ncbi:MAG: Mur ligase family protein [Methanosphaera stadtmanae]|nr:Mur ligase family protein [Methanosphaera stadtmanae]
MSNINTLDLAKKIEGKLYGSNIELNGNFTFLNKASKNDIVIRHWINETGIQIAHDKGVSCLITQNPQGNAIEVAKELNFPLIVTEHIEYATAYALNYSVKKYAKDAFKMSVTGTNGKSTTTHLLFTIFSDLGFNTYTNTDAESEGNTLIDPRVSDELTEYYNKNGNIDVIALEVSEVQGWDDKLMNNHSCQMINALGADVAIITNASFDHMNLVESFDELLYEIEGAARALTKQDKQTLLVLNYEDENIRNMYNKVENNPDVKVMFFGDYDRNNLLDISYKENVGIFSKDKLYVKYEDLPFTSYHFIQDIMAAIAVCEYKSLNKDDVVNSLKKYKPLARRFIKLRENPVIIDDFAHNPSGIHLTIENGAKLGEHLYVIDAIRGSRGEDINIEIAEALVEILKVQDNYSLILTTSTDVVNHLNTVTDSELAVFIKVLNDNSISYELFDNLEESLISTVNKANESDVILLLGAQGMDPARSLLEQNDII